MPQISSSDDSGEPASPPCLELPFAEGINPPGHGRRTRVLVGRSWAAATSGTAVGRGPHAHPSLLLSTRHPGLAERAFIRPRSLSPPQTTSPYQGQWGRAQPGSSWLELAPFCRENRVISRAKLPIPSQNTAMLGEALYSHRQTTHICFLTVGIAPTGTERTGSLLSPSPCDCKLCAEQCVANTILPSLSWALVDTWSVCPSPDQPKSPRASPARMQNVLPGSSTSRSLQSCSALSCLSEPPRWTQNAASAGGRQQLFPTLLSSRGGKLRLQGATGSRAAHSGYSSLGSEGDQLQAWKMPAWHRHKDQVTMNLQGRCPSHLSDRGSLETSSPLLSS